MMRLAPPHLLLCLVLAALAAAPPAPAAMVDRIVAWIDEEPVSLSDVERRLVEYQTRGDIPAGPLDSRRLAQALQIYIDEQLLLRAAEAAGVEAPAEAIDNQLEPMIARLEAREGGPAQLDALLGRTGETRDSLRQALREQLRREWAIARLVQSRVDISDQDVEEFQKSRRALGQATRRYHLAHFFIPLRPADPPDKWRQAEEVAWELRRQVARQGDFADAAAAFAARYADFRAQTGSLGALDPAELDAALLRTLEGVEPGQTTQPVRTSRGIHVLHLQRITTPRQILSAIRFEEHKAKWIEELRNAATVRVIDPALKP